MALLGGTLALGASACETYLDLELQGEAMVGRRHSCARLSLWALSLRGKKLVLTEARCLLCLGGHAQTFHLPSWHRVPSCSRVGLGAWKCVQRGRPWRPRVGTSGLPLSQSLLSPRPLCSSHCQCLPLGSLPHSSHQHHQLCEHLLHSQAPGSWHTPTGKTPPFTSGMA